MPDTFALPAPGYTRTFQSLPYGLTLTYRRSFLSVYPSARISLYMPLTPLPSNHLDPVSRSVSLHLSSFIFHRSSFDFDRTESVFGKWGAAAPTHAVTFRLLSYLR